MTEGLRRIIAAVAAGAGEGAEALRSAGVGLTLEGYTVEVMVDSDDPIPAASVRLVFGTEAQHGGLVSPQDPG
jgi:hypothetical protein